MGCIYPSERQGLSQHQTNMDALMLTPFALPDTLYTQYSVTAMFTFNYRCPFMNQATSRFKRQGWFMSASEKQPGIIPFLFEFVRDI